MYGCTSPHEEGGQGDAGRRVRDPPPSLLWKAEGQWDDEGPGGDGQEGESVQVRNRPAMLWW